MGFGCAGFLLGMLIGKKQEVIEDILEEWDTWWDRVKFWMALWLDSEKEFRNLMFSEFLRCWSSLCNS